MNNKNAFPLDWPQGWPKTEPRKRKDARYTVTFDRAQRDLWQALIRLDHKNRNLAIVSTNIPVRQDGMHYASWKNPDDPGVAVYFVRNGKNHVIACDHWRHIKDNMRAVGLTIEALRALERTGASGILDRAYSGFEQLPDYSGEQDWRQILGLPGNPGVLDVQRKFKKLAQQHHPDKGGDPEYFKKISAARDKALEELQT